MQLCFAGANMRSFIGMCGIPKPIFLLRWRPYLTVLYCHITDFSVSSFLLIRQLTTASSLSRCLNVKQLTSNCGYLKVPCTHSFDCMYFYANKYSILLARYCLAFGLNQINWGPTSSGASYSVQEEIHLSVCVSW